MKSSSISDTSSKMASSTGSLTPDLERNENRFLMNNTVHDFSWKDLTVTVKDRRTKQPRNLIDASSGTVQQGIYYLSTGFWLSQAYVGNSLKTIN